MKHIPILLFTILVIVSGCKETTYLNNGNKYPLEPLPFKYVEDGKWGFIDANGNIKLETNFKNKPESFQNGFAIISNDTVFYYINAKGDTIGTYYFGANSFSDNRALVRNKDSELFFIDETGTIIFKVDTIAKNQLRQCRSFHDGLSLFITHDLKYGFMDKSGKVVIKPKYTSADDFSENISYAEIKNDTNNKVQRLLIDKQGNVIKELDESTKWITPFNEGRAAFKDSSGCGYLNKKGEVLIKQQKKWQDLTNFVNGYASYMRGGSWGVIDSTGKSILNAIYEMPPLFYNGLAIIKENDKYGVINLKGEKIIDCLYDHIAYPMMDSCFFAKNGKYYLMIDKTGKQINDQELFRIDLVQALVNGFKTGYIVVGEKMGISYGKLTTASSDENEMMSSLNAEARKLYNN